MLYGNVLGVCNKRALRGKKKKPFLFVVVILIFIFDRMVMKYSIVFMLFLLLLFKSKR